MTPTTILLVPLHDNDGDAFPRRFLAGLLGSADLTPLPLLREPPGGVLRASGVWYSDDGERYADDLLPCTLPVSDPAAVASDARYIGRETGQLAMALVHLGFEPPPRLPGTTTRKRLYTGPDGFLRGGSAFTTLYTLDGPVVTTTKDNVRPQCLADVSPVGWLDILPVD